MHDSIFWIYSNVFAKYDIVSSGLPALAIPSLIDKVGMKKDYYDKMAVCKKVPQATIETNFGNIIFELLPNYAPETVRNFVKLAKSNFYDGVLFHRIIPGFMIQGGDPNTKQPDKSSWGMGGPGYTIKAEFNSKPHMRGVVSMARSDDPNSAGSQFFIVTGDSTFLDGQYTAFGEVRSGMEVADKIGHLPRGKNDCPDQEAKIIRITISE